MAFFSFNKWNDIVRRPTAARLDGQFLKNRVGSSACLITFVIDLQLVTTSNSAVIKT